MRSVTYARAARAALSLAVILLAACGPRDAASSASSESSAAVPRTAADSQAAHVADVVAHGGVVDSILPIAEHLRRFRAALTTRPETLSFASPTIDALVGRWADAIAARDTAALNRLVINRAEFAWLYYADSRMAKPPYEAPPGLLWGQILASSDEGAQRMLNKYGGQRLVVKSVSCPGDPEVEGSNRIRQNCVATLAANGVSLPVTRYFGSIIERDGRFKLLGLANRL